MTHLVSPYTSRVHTDSSGKESRWPFYRDVICIRRLDKKNAPKANEVFQASLKGDVHGNGIYIENFCERREIQVSDLQRRLWQAFFGPIEYTDLATGINEAEDDHIGFTEGGKFEWVIHKKKERSSALIKEVKRRALKRDPLLRCEVCEFSFIERYGDVGSEFIEAHHRVPISELNSARQTKVEEIALLCANCHRMIHRRRPWLSVGQLTERIQGRTF